MYFEDQFSIKKEISICFFVVDFWGDASVFFSFISVRLVDRDNRKEISDEVQIHSEGVCSNSIGIVFLFVWISIVCLHRFKNALDVHRKGTKEKIFSRHLFKYILMKMFFCMLIVVPVAFVRSTSKIFSTQWIKIFFINRWVKLFTFFSLFLFLEENLDELNRR